MTGGRVVSNVGKGAASDSDGDTVRVKWLDYSCLPHWARHVIYQSWPSCAPFWCPCIFLMPQFDSIEVARNSLTVVEVAFTVFGHMTCISVSVVSTSR